MKYLGWLLGLDNVTAIDQIDPTFIAPWASEEFGTFWVCLGAVALLVLSIAFYMRSQSKAAKQVRLSLGVCRGVLLSLLFVTLADPSLRLTLTNIREPLVFLLIDGTESMLIEDEWTPEQRTALDTAVGRSSSRATDASEPHPPLRSRLEYVKAWIGQNENENLLRQLELRKKVRIQPFIFNGNASTHLRRIDTVVQESRLDLEQLAKQLTAEGQVSAFGTLLDEVPQQLGSANLSAILMVSDFAHNSGPAPLGASGSSPAAKLGVPIFTIGVGATQAVDLAVELQTDPKMKKAERSTVVVKLKQTGLGGQNVSVRLVARALNTDKDRQSELNLGQRLVTLGSMENTIVEFPFTPQEAGRFEISAVADPMPGEAVEANNVVSREVTIIDDYLRLMYVAYEPSWEWRFIKEVFHRDKLVGIEGFRTFLSSSDPRVRESNVLFLPSITPKRSEFFASDVLFLDDMPQSALSPRFCEMAKEFVGELGGGLVVIAGPRFGPRELHGTVLAEMLPVTLDPNLRMRDEREFEVKLTVEADQFPFMRLQESPVENVKAWKNLGALPWYQPVVALNRKATALAVHPFDKCADGEQLQPLIAVGRYGKGEVVYLGFNETWRLRRRFGEKYYRQFWSQLIYRVGMSHALGASKRFVPRVDRPQYRAEETVTYSVEAYDENYEPLSAERLTNQALTAQLTIPSADGSPSQLRELAIPLLRKGLFEARFPVFTPGEYSLKVRDPVTDRFEEKRFEVTTVSAERARAVRDEQLQRELASRTQGRSYDLLSASRLLDDLRAEPQIETVTRNHSLWSTPLWFLTVMTLMLGEWFVRKMVSLT